MSFSSPPAAASGLRVAQQDNFCVPLVVAGRVDDRQCLFFGNQFQPASFADGLYVQFLENAIEMGPVLDFGILLLAETYAI